MSDPWRQHLSELRRFVGKRVSNPHEAEDVVQDVLTRAHEALHQLESAERRSAWLARIAARLIIDQACGKPRSSGRGQERGRRSRGNVLAHEVVLYIITALFAHNADVVDAINVLARGHRVLACGEPVQSGRSMKQEPAEATQMVFV